MLAESRSGGSTSYVVPLVLDAVAPSRRTAMAFGPHGAGPRGTRAVMVWCDATRCCASIVRRRGSLTRGRAMVLQGRGASSRLVHPSQTGHWDCHASLLGQSDAKTRSDRRTPRVSPIHAIRATHTP